MPEKRITLDVFLLTLQIPEDQPASAITRIRRTLNRPAFSTQLQEVVAILFQQFPTLAPVTVSISR